MWSRFKKRVFGVGANSRAHRPCDDSSSLDESTVHACCVQREFDDITRSQLLSRFAKDDSHVITDKKDNVKVKRKLSWFSKSRDSRHRPTSVEVVTSAGVVESAGGLKVDMVKCSSLLDKVENEVKGQSSLGQETFGKELVNDLKLNREPKSSRDVDDEVEDELCVLEMRSASDAERLDIGAGMTEYCIKEDKGTFGTSNQLVTPSCCINRLSPPKLKRRVKQSTSGTESESRRPRVFRTAPEPPDVVESSASPSPTTPLADITVNTTQSQSVQSPGSNKVTGKRVPPPVPVRKYPLSSSSLVVQPLKLVSPSSEPSSVGKSSPSSTWNSPDSGSDDTEGKESGYVTLDDLQAQLMRSSWSSDETRSDVNVASVPSTGQESQPAITSASPPVPFSVPALPSLPTESGEDDVWPAPPSPLSDVCTAPSTIGDMVTTDATHSTVTPVVRFTFTVKLDSQLLKRRRLQPATQSPDHNIITSPGTDLVCLSSTPPAVVIPDVVVCADTSSAVGKTCGNTVTRTKSLPPVQTSTAVVAMVDGRFEFSSQTLSGQFQQKQYEKEMGGEACGLTSTSCQTEELMVVESEILKPHDVTYACSCANQKPNSSLVVSRKSEDKQAPVTTSVTTVDTSQQLLCRCNKNCHSTPSHGVDSVDSVGCVDDDMFHQRRQLKCTNSHHDDGSYLRPLITRVYANNNPSHTEAVVKCSRTPADSDLTHMSWGEVLEEAQLMGIPLHAPEQRSSPCRATVVSCQSSCVDMSTVSPSRYRQSAAGQQLSQQVINQKISLSLNTTKTSFRDMFRFPRLFGRKKSANDGSVKRSRSMEAPSHRIQSRTLPVPPNTRQRDHQLELTDGGRKRQSRLSRYSASSCPPVSNSQLTISRATSVSSASRQTCGDYFVSSWTAGSSCSGSILAYHRQHADVQDKDVDDADDDDVVVDDVCVSPSMASFTSGSICSQSAPWRCLPSTPRSTVTSPGLCSSTWRCTNLTTDFVNCLSQLQHCGWYWGAIGFDEAEAKLLNRRDGSFLVRDSSDERYILSLSFRSLGTTHHTRIEHYKGSFSFCSQQPTHDSYSPATTIVEFIEASMTASRAGCTLYYLRPRSPDLPPAPVRLLYPVSRFHSMHTLRHLCKFAILRHVRLDMVDRLPLAPRLKEYLKHGRAT